MTRSGESVRQRVYLYWHEAWGSPPRPGEHCEWPNEQGDLSAGVVDMAHASEGAIEKRKLTILVER